MKSPDIHQQLAAFGLDAPAFQLADGTLLNITEIVRTVPGKRLVCSAQRSGQAVYAKIFFGRHAMRHAARDARGVVLLERAEISTPTLLYSGNPRGLQAHVLVFEAILDAVNAEQYLHTLTKTERFQLVSGIVAQVAKHHQHQLMQTDMYLKNFLISSSTIFTLDGDGIRRIRGICRGRKKLLNLAVLLSKFDALDDDWISDIYYHYCRHANRFPEKRELGKLRNLVGSVRTAAASDYADKKVFRNCTDVKVTQSFKCFKASAAGFDMTAITIPYLDQCLSEPQRNLKNGNTCSVGLAKVGQNTVVIKRYNIKNFWHGFGRLFRKSRAAMSWANSHRLLISNVHTAKPLALIEERWLWLRRRAYYMAEYIDAPDLAEYFAVDHDPGEHRLVAENLAKLMHQLWRLRYSHGDMKASNIKINALKPVLIDLDAMRAHGSGGLSMHFFRQAHIRDLKRLLLNWPAQSLPSNLIKQALLAEYVNENTDILHAAFRQAGLA